jgi:2-oxopent-4-enoate/cis-2-oxohex-4-enoate hydratase
MAELDFQDPLAAALWAARREGATVSFSGGGELTLERADRIATELYGALESGGGRQVAWKIGAGDAAAQQRFGTDRPFTAPVHSSYVLTDGATLSLAGMVAPRLEAEIGLRFDSESPAVLPCVEIIDCRFPGWDIQIAGVLADFGLQGAMVFGQPAATGPEVHAVVRRDGEVLAEASGSVEAAAAVSRQALGERRLAQFPLVASGSLITPVPLEQGSHEIDFGELGRLRLEVTA